MNAIKACKMEGSDCASYLELTKEIETREDVESEYSNQVMIRAKLYVFCCIPDQYSRPVFQTRRK